MARKRTTVEIDEDLLEWHKKTFPDTSLWTTINNLLQSYKDVIEADPPTDYYLRGAKELHERLTQDLKNLGEL